jgi:alpha-mannosidase
LLRIRFVAASLLVALTHLCFSAAITPQACPIFRIGTFNRSSGEFSSRSPSSTVNFVVGSSDAAHDWYATQPVALAEKPPAPWKITFSQASAPATAYQLHLAFLIESLNVTIQSATVPVLQININGKQGLFYLHPSLDFTNGDRDNSFDATYSHADVVFTFPGSYLHQGTNTVALLPLSQTDKVKPDAVLAYDAMELLPLSSGSEASTSLAQITPTIFFKKQNDQDEEFVDVFIRDAKRFTPGGSVDLSLDGIHYQEAFKRSQDFGEERFELTVAPFAAHTSARLSWNLAGRKHHMQQFINPEKKWTLFLIPHIHLDVGYSDFQAKVATIQSRVVDEALDLLAQHPDFRFSLDGDWTMQQFLKTRTPAEQERVVAAMQQKKLFNPAQFASLLTGFPTAETLIRSLYPSANFSREHGTPFNYANITDVPSYSWSYASILHAAGIGYFLSGCDDDRGPVLLQGHLNETSPMWWEGPDGKKILLWYSRGYMQMQFIFGLPPLLSSGRELLPVFLQMYRGPKYRANSAIIFGSQVENTDLFPQQAELVGQWNRVYSYPRLQYSGVHEAMANIADQFGNEIPTIRGDGGPYWEDGIASDSYYAALERANESRAPSAEKLATISSLADPRLAVDKTELSRMWTNMVLMDEHTWLSYNSVSDPTSEEAVKQLAVKDSRAIQANEQIDWLMRSSMAALAEKTSAGVGSLIVFNTLNWARSGPVFYDLDKTKEIVDASTGRAVPFETINEGNNYHRVRFVASDVPAVGYKVFLLRTAPGTPGGVSKSISKVMENPYYRVELDPASGALRSIYDKQLRRELVNQAGPYRFGQYLYVTGGDKSPNSILQYSPNYARPPLQIHPAQQGHLLSVARTPDGWVARMESTAPNTKTIATEIRLFDNKKKIELSENIDKAAVMTKEAVYFAFPFAMSKPEFRYEIQTGTVDPEKDMYPGAGHEWFSVQHWVSVQQDGVSGTVMPLDSSLVTLGDINRGAWPLTFGERPGSIFSYVMANYYDTNYRAEQGGHFHFRYVFTSGPSTDAPKLSQMGWQEMTPLEINEITDEDKALNTKQRFGAVSDSFLKVDDSDLLLQTWKPAEDGHGTIMRFLDLGGAERSVTIQLPLLELQQVWQTDAVERDQALLPLQGNIGFRVTVHPHELVTIRLVGKTVNELPGT